MKHLISDTYLANIADAIRQKDGTQTTMTVSDMPNRIQNIPSSSTDYMAQRVNSTLSSYTIPNTCTVISAYSFYWQPLTSITIPSSVTRISDYAFAYCPLSSVFLPRTLTYVDQYAFYSLCDTRMTYTLTSVTYDDNMQLEGGLQMFGANRNLTTLNNFKITNFKDRTMANAMFQDTGLVGDISIEDSATIGQRTFNNTRSAGILYIHLTQTDASLLTSKYSFGPGSTTTNRSFNFDHCRLVVPVGMLSDYQSAFPSYSSIMIEETT